MQGAPGDVSGSAARPRPRPSPRPADADVEPVELRKHAPSAAPDTGDVTPEDADVMPDEQRPARPEAGGVRSLPLAWFPAAVLAVAAVLLLALLGVFSFRGYWAKPGGGGPTAPSTAQQERVLAAAKTCFATVNTYDYRKLDAALAAGLSCTTGKFTNDYRTAFNAQIKPNAPTIKIVRTTQVNKAGIASISPDGKQWVVLVYGQLSISSVQTAKGTPRIDPLDGVVTMDLVDGKWLIAKIDTDAGNGLSG
jgi:hypothetical protein